MNPAAWTELGDGITCVDAGYVEPGLACCYLLESRGEYAVIETGTAHSLANLQALLAARAIAPAQLRYVIPTHVHLDHAGGAGAMMAAFPRAELLVHPRGAPHLADPQRLVAASRAVYGDALFELLYGDVVPVAAARMRSMGDGEHIELAGRRLQFRHTEGHALHHFCIWDEATAGWFAGDTFGLSYPWCRFPAGDFLLPSTTPSQFDPQALLASLTLLGSYQPRRMYLTHYGALEYTPDKQALLAQQVEVYGALARDCADATVLEQRLADYTLALLRRHGAGMPEPALRARLAMDMRLNAQGLLAWCTRLARG